MRSAASKAAQWGKEQVHTEVMQKIATKFSGRVDLLFVN